MTVGINQMMNKTFPFQIQAEWRKHGGEKELISYSFLSPILGHLLSAKTTTTNSLEINHIDMVLQWYRHYNNNRTTVFRLRACSTVQRNMPAAVASRLMEQCCKNSHGETGIPDLLKTTTFIQTTRLAICSKPMLERRTI